MKPSLHNTPTDNTLPPPEVTAPTASSKTPLCEVSVQLLLAQIHVNNGRLTDAFNMFEVAARSADPRALNMLGRAYERGWGVTRNPSTAATYFSHAASLGDAWAMFNLADLYMAGDGVPLDIPKAYDLYLSAAQNGVTKAFTMLGLIIEDGAIPNAEPDAALKLFEAAANAGDCWGYLNMARHHLSSNNIDPALHCFSRALDLGFHDVFLATERLLANRRDPRLQNVVARARHYLNRPSADR